ncbi:hypothetical protein NG798_27650 [Ancylothrix sp. C2]|uniref:hypothetical protein n=1 Tax=Ancylothrix sp. D3o TaxID=2953691 RepID=UPI0021BA7B6E|nr:hypothetical protein [Ancylothrix sp. D3o]MCT7953576.1 hypothetical protein [Ancylothrix sp. D3o]
MNLSAVGNVEGPVNFESVGDIERPVEFAHASRFWRAGGRERAGERREPLDREEAGVTLGNFNLWLLGAGTNKIEITGPKKPEEIPYFTGPKKPKKITQPPNYFRIMRSATGPVELTIHKLFNSQQKLLAIHRHR